MGVTGLIKRLISAKIARKVRLNVDGSITYIDDYTEPLLFRGKRSIKNHSRKKNSSQTDINNNNGLRNNVSSSKCVGDTATTASDVTVEIKNCHVNDDINDGLSLHGGYKQLKRSSFCKVPAPLRIAVDVSGWIARVCHSRSNTGLLLDTRNLGNYERHIHDDSNLLSDKESFVRQCVQTVFHRIVRLATGTILADSTAPSSNGVTLHTAPIPSISATGRLRVLVVFDGATPPAKARACASRKNRREKARSEVDANDSAATKSRLYGEAGAPTELHCIITLKLQHLLRTHGIPFIVSPYEADGQLAHLTRQGLVDLVLTEDSDLVSGYGCLSTLYKYDHDSRTGFLVKLRDVTSSMVECGSANNNDNGFNLMGFDRVMMAVMSITAGCDYCDSLRGIGIVTANRIVREAFTNDANGYHPIEEVFRQVYQSCYDQFVSAPRQQQYQRSFLSALFTYLHSIVYDPVLKRCIIMNSGSETSSFQPFPSLLRYAPYADCQREMLQKEAIGCLTNGKDGVLAQLMGLGYINPKTKCLTGEDYSDKNQEIILGQIAHTLPPLPNDVKEAFHKAMVEDDVSEIDDVWLQFQSMRHGLEQHHPSAAVADNIDEDNHHRKPPSSGTKDAKLTNPSPYSKSTFVDLSSNDGSDNYNSTIESGTKINRKEVVDLRDEKNEEKDSNSPIGTQSPNTQQHEGKHLCHIDLDENCNHYNKRRASKNNEKEDKFNSETAASISLNKCNNSISTHKEATKTIFKIASTNTNNGSKHSHQSSNNNKSRTSTKDCCQNLQSNVSSSQEKDDVTPSHSAAKTAAACSNVIARRSSARLSPRKITNSSPKKNLKSSSLPNRLKLARSCSSSNKKGDRKDIGCNSDDKSSERLPKRHQQVQSVAAIRAGSLNVTQQTPPRLSCKKKSQIEAKDGKRAVGNFCDSHHQFSTRLSQIYKKYRIDHISNIGDGHVGDHLSKQSSQQYDDKRHKKNKKLQQLKQQQVQAQEKKKLALSQNSSSTGGDSSKISQLSSQSQSEQPSSGNQLSSELSFLSSGSSPSMLLLDKSPSQSLSSSSRRISKRRKTK